MCSGLGKLYCRTPNCIATWGSGLQGECVTIHRVYCDRGGLGLEDCVAIHSIVLRQAEGWQAGDFIAIQSVVL